MNGNFNKIIRFFLQVVVLLHTFAEQGILLTRRVLGVAVARLVL